jgi:hypothetical protein
MQPFDSARSPTKLIVKNLREVKGCSVANAGINRICALPVTA